jgi:sugar phosphate isomerase/epimerase
LGIIGSFGARLAESEARRYSRQKPQSQPPGLGFSPGFFECQQGSVLDVFVAASTRSFVEKSFAEACFLLDDLGFDKLELHFSTVRDHLNLGKILREPDAFLTHFRDSTRLSPIAINVEEETPTEDLKGLSRLAKQLRIAQITIPAARLGTPFNSEVDRLRDCLKIGNQDGVRMSIQIKTGHLTEDPDTAVELCRAAPGLGLTLDPSYLLCGPLHREDVESLYPYAFHAHLRDSTPELLQIPMGLGQIDFSRLISNLERYKYQRALSVELIPELMPLDQRPIELRKIRMLLETLL